jgi:hypothetical protein
MSSYSWALYGAKKACGGTGTANAHACDEC